MSTLATELTTDPEGLGYAPLITSQDYTGIAQLLTARTRTKLAQYVDRARFQRAILPALVSLRNKDAGVRDSWLAILSVINSNAVIEAGNSEIQGIITLAISDGLLTSQQAAGIGLTACSRLEEIGLPGIVTAAEVEAALA